MAARLVALDLPGGPDFVVALRRIWDAGDAAFPVDQRLPPAAKADVLAAMRVGEEVEPGDALVVATSGSTGTPRGVVLTHDAVAASAMATSDRLAVRDDDHWLACLPLSHVGGLSVVTRALHRDVRLTVLPGFDAERVMGAGATLVLPRFVESGEVVVVDLLVCCDRCPFGEETACIGDARHCLSVCRAS